MPLAGLPDLRRFPPNEPLILVEGPVAQAALSKAGRLALGIWGTSNCPSVGRLKPCLGRMVLLWPDNDDPGHKLMFGEVKGGNVVERLRSIGHSDIWVVEWDEAPHKGDAADAIARGVDLDALYASAVAVTSVAAVNGSHGSLLF